eukprot:SAG31_NODE_1342_length_8700_cov_12.667829_4_plen_49_part_00
MMLRVYQSRNEKDLELGIIFLRSQRPIEFLGGKSTVVLGARWVPSSLH